MAAFNKSRLMLALHLLCVVSRSAALLDDYHCGLNHKPWTKVLSYSTSFMCDPYTLSEECCKCHDDCCDQAQVRMFWWLREHCDDEFRRCVKQLYYGKGQYLCGWFVHATHSAALSIAKFFGFH